MEKDTIKKRKRKPAEEPVYFKKFPEEAQKRHEEKIQVQKELIDVLKDFINKK